MNNNNKIAEYSEFPKVDRRILDDVKDCLQDKFADFIKGCLKHATTYFADTLESASERNAVQTQLTAHALKSITGQMGAARFTEIVRDLEDEVLDKDEDEICWKTIDGLVIKIKQEFPSTVKYYKDILPD